MNDEDLIDIFLAFQRGVSASCKIHVIVEDENDNPPVFTSIYYWGEISEGSPLGTLVRQREQEQSGSNGAAAGGSSLQQGKPLVLQSRDLDDGIHALVTYAVIEEEMKTVFHIDPTTGALLLVTALDYERKPFYSFHVRAFDGGGLLSTNIAVVNVSVLNVNDHAPKIKPARVELLLPVINGLVVHKMEADDADGDKIEFNITRGNNRGFFSIDKDSGEIQLSTVENFGGSKHVLEISVTDGRFTSVATINIHVKTLERNDNFAFRERTFFVSVPENSTKVTNLLSLSVLGTELGEKLDFKILNPSPYFVVTRTSGVVATVGKRLDREIESKHTLLIEVRGGSADRLDRCFVEVSVLDVNDNCPSFLHLPYIAVIPATIEPGDLVIQVINLVT